MAWAWWLAPPVIAGTLAALRAWWGTRRSVAPTPSTTDDAMRAHQDYLDALARPVRGTARVSRADT